MIPIASCRVFVEFGILCVQVRSLFDVNVFGVITVTRSFVPLLREHGPGSRVINIGSISGKYSPPVHGIYGATSTTQCHRQHCVVLIVMIVV